MTVALMDCKWSGSALKQLILKTFEFKVCLTAGKRTLFIGFFSQNPLYEAKYGYFEEAYHTFNVLPSS